MTEDRFFAVVRLMILQSLCAERIIRKSGISYVDFPAYLDRTLRAVTIHDWDDRCRSCGNTATLFSLLSP
jgi:hypothetical protein